MWVHSERNHGSASNSAFKIEVRVFIGTSLTGGKKRLIAILYTLILFPECVAKAAKGSCL